MIYNVVLVSAMQQNESVSYIYIHTHTHTLFFIFPFYLGHQRSLSRVPHAL